MEGSNAFTATSSGWTGAPLQPPPRLGQGLFEKDESILFPRSRAAPPGAPRGTCACFASPGEGAPSCTWLLPPLTWSPWPRSPRMQIWNMVFDLADQNCGHFP